MSDLAKRIAALSPEQRAAFEQRLKKQGLSAPTVQVIGRRPAMETIPLSFGQQRLWFLHQLDPSSPAYNAPSAVRLSGPLDVDALQHSLNEVVRRHEVLRSTFTTIDNQPVQVIAPQLDLPLPILDLRMLHPEGTRDQREAEALQLALEEFQRPFDLQSGPLLRTRLLQLDDQEYQLLFTMHHIVTDGWSTELLIAEMTALYAALTSGQPPEAARLPEPPVQYPDFALWQRDYLRGAVLESQLAYWRQQLADVPRLLNLPTDRPRPAVQSYHGTMTSFALDESLHRALTALAQRENVTLFMLMLAAFDVLLGRWSGQ
ncbi:MAG TPA: condensation domain-containing protein, partial [Herpetosiphonaceae bacterium]